MNQKVMYTQEQLDIALLNQKNDDLHRIMVDMKQDIKEMKLDGKSQFLWLMGSLSVLYVSLIGTLVTALAKSLKWF